MSESGELPLFTKPQMTSQSSCFRGPGLPFLLGSGIAEALHKLETIVSVTGGWETMLNCQRAHPMMNIEIMEIKHQLERDRKGSSSVIWMCPITRYWIFLFVSTNKIMGSKGTKRSMAIWRWQRSSLIQGPLKHISTPAVIDSEHPLSGERGPHKHNKDLYRFYRHLYNP